MVIDRKCRAEALDVLTNDLQVFAKRNEELFKEITQLMTFDNIRYEFCSSCAISSILTVTFSK